MTPQRKKTIIFTVIGILLIGVIAGLVYKYIKGEEDKRFLFLYGNVDVRQVDISFRVAGQVERLFFEEGDCVREGEIMACLNETPYISEIQQAQSLAASIEANLENAEQLLKRRQELSGIGGVSAQEVDDALANRNALQSQLASARASEAVNIYNLSYTKAYAPTDGIILTRIREPGTVVNPTDPVYTLSVSTPVWIRAYVTETDLGKIWYGMRAEVATDAQPDFPYVGKIGFISPVSEFTPKTVQTTQLRTDLVYRLRIYLENADCLIKQGMPVTVRLPLNQECKCE